MTQPPVKPSPFDRIIKEASRVTTKGGFAALNCILLLLALFFVLFLSEDSERLILSILVLGIWAIFAILAFWKLTKFEEQELNKKSKKQ